MGKRGPKSAPAAVKKAKGNPGRRPVKKEEKQVIEVSGIGAGGAGYSKSDGVEGKKSDSEGATQPMPNWLSGEARKIWHAIVPNLTKLNIMQSIDTFTFGRYCENYALWLKAMRHMREHGAWYTSTSPHGVYERVRSAFTIADRLDRTLRQEEDNFALNPAERQRLFLGRAETPYGDLFNNPAPAGKDTPDEEQVPPSAVGYGLH